MLRGFFVLVSFCAAAAALCACGDPAVRAAGEPCFASSECAPGLVCDLAAEQPVCATMGSGGSGGGEIDAAVPLPDADPSQPDAAPVDAAPVDASPVDAAPEM